MKRLTLSVLCLMLMTAWASTQEMASYLEELEAWHAKRLAKLSSEDGYLSLSGLYWLRDKPVKVEGFGTATLRDGLISLKIDETGLGDKDDITTVLDPELPEGKYRVRRGTVSAYAIKRGPWVGIRVKDSEAPTRVKFRGVERFPAESKWIVPGRLIVSEEEVDIDSVVGVSSAEKSPGWAEFEWEGQSYRARLIGEPDDRKFFLVFSDASAGRSTYPACRFLSVERTVDGGLVLDFNKAINPACAFTRFATCPLPPQDNIFPFSIEAGEKKP